MRSAGLVISAIVLTLSLSCKRNGTGGDASISFYVKHHAALIPGATVYIKYGADEFPGSDVSKYDASVVCETTGPETAHATFTGLLKGKYYLYATGFDSAIMQTVTGGIPVKIEKKSDQLTYDVPVKE